MTEHELSVLIVDDEKLDRDAYRLMLSRGLPWLRVIGEVENGLDAVRFCCEHTPDIVLMDIHMPKLSGLEAIRLLRAEGSDISFVIISAYDYFEHAKEALDLGVLGFMVKPVSETELIREMHRVCTLVEKKKHRLIDRLNTLGSVGMPDQPVDELFYAIRAGSPDMIRTLQKMHGISAETGMIAIVETDMDTQNEVLPWLCRRCRGISRVLWHGQRLFVLMLKGLDAEPIQGIFHGLCSEAQLRFQLHMRIRIGPPYASLREICHSYMQAVALMDSHEDVCCCDADVRRKYPYPFDSEIRLLEALQGQDLQRALEVLMMIQSEVDTNFAHGSFERQKLVMFDLFVTLNHQEPRAGLENDSELLELSSYMCIHGKEELNAYFRECLNLLVDRQSIVKVPNRIRPILDYIYANYNRDVPLSVLSARFFFSQGYLGRILRETTGLSYIEFVTHLRMEHAMQLLKDSSRSIAEISAEVGYKDSNYFSKVFKKANGKTPQAYRGEASTSEVVDRRR